MHSGVLQRRNTPQRHRRAFSVHPVPPAARVARLLPHASTSPTKSSCSVFWFDISNICPVSQREIPAK
eukprot:2400853-Rhodomonas_salina.2